MQRYNRELKSNYSLFLFNYNTHSLKKYFSYRSKAGDPFQNYFLVVAVWTLSLCYQISVQAQLVTTEG